MTDPLELTTELVGGVPIIRLRGPLMFGHDLGAIHALARSLRAGGHDRIALDLAGVPAVDSSGLTALLDVSATFGRVRDHVMLLRPSHKVRDALALIRVDSLFEVVADEAELMARLSATEPGTADPSSET